MMVLVVDDYDDDHHVPYFEHELSYEFDDDFVQRIFDLYYSLVLMILTYRYHSLISTCVDIYWF